MFGSYYKGPCFTFISLVLSEIQADCGGQTGLTVWHFLRWQRQSQRFDIFRLQSRSFRLVTKLELKLSPFEITKVILKSKLCPQKLRQVCTHVCSVYEERQKIPFWALFVPQGLGFQSLVPEMVGFLSYVPERVWFLSKSIPARVCVIKFFAHHDTVFFQLCNTGYTFLGCMCLKGYRFHPKLFAGEGNSSNALTILPNSGRNRSIWNSVQAFKLTIYNTVSMFNLPVCDARLRRVKSAWFTRCHFSHTQVNWKCITLFWADQSDIRIS